jgi:hypothetical protein
VAKITVIQQAIASLRGAVQGMEQTEEHTFLEGSLSALLGSLSTVDDDTRTEVELANDERDAAKEALGRLSAEVSQLASLREMLEVVHYACANHGLYERELVKFQPKLESVLAGEAGRPFVDFVDNYLAFEAEPKAAQILAYQQDLENEKAKNAFRARMLAVHDEGVVARKQGRAVDENPYRVDAAEQTPDTEDLAYANSWQSGWGDEHRTSLFIELAFLMLKTDTEGQRREYRAKAAEALRRYGYLG